MGLLDALLDVFTAHPFLVVPLPLLLLTISTIIYRAYLHPLARVPGPFLAKCTSLYLYYHTYIGDEASHIDALHAQYGPVLRVGPNDVDIADGAALAPIYTDRGGFPKSACYANFDIDGHATIFSALTLAHRAPRAKAVSPLFSTASIRANADVIAGCVDQLVVRMREEAATRRPVNLLNLTRSLALDAISSYLFRVGYNGMGERGGTLSASPFVDAFVAVGRFFYLPTPIFQLVERAAETFWPDAKAARSMGLVERFASRLVDAAQAGKGVGGLAGSGNYPARLLEGGIGESEVHSQCKDLIFAGTDSTGMNLAMICWFLAKHPEKYEILRTEILANAASPSPADLQSLPYLRGVVREGLRLSMANPTRLPRRVPPGPGFNFSGHLLPPGTDVGVSAYSLHLNPHVFADPHAFRPERWAEGAATPEMTRDWIPFGQGSRACIARNLATVELFMATEGLVRGDVLRGARCVEGEIKLVEWFNSRVVGERVELMWD